MKLKDVLATPFVLTGFILFYISVLIGGRWTARYIVDFFDKDDLRYKRDLRCEECGSNIKS